MGMIRSRVQFPRQRRETLSRKDNCSGVSNSEPKAGAEREGGAAAAGAGAAGAEAEAEAEDEDWTFCGSFMVVCGYWW